MSGFDGIKGARAGATIVAIPTTPPLLQPKPGLTRVGTVNIDMLNISVQFSYLNLRYLTWYGYHSHGRSRQTTNYHERNPSPPERTPCITNATIFRQASSPATCVLVLCWPAIRVKAPPRRIHTSIVLLGLVVSSSCEQLCALEQEMLRPPPLRERLVSIDSLDCPPPQ